MEQNHTVLHSISDSTIMDAEALSIPPSSALQPETVDLSFIIVNYHSSSDLRNCLRSIQDSEFAGSFEIMVVDNSEGDPKLEEVMKEYPDVRWIINSRNIGFGRANNQAARVASGSCLMLVNPDVILSPDTPAVLNMYLDHHPEAAIVAPKVLSDDGSLQYSCRRFPTPWSGLFNRYSLLTRFFPDNRFSRHYLMTDFDHNETRSVDWVSGCCMLIRKDAFFKAGLFDEHFFLFIEDVDLCKTMHKLGQSVVYHPATQVVHRISSSNHRVPFRVILLRHYGMSYYHRKNIPANPLMRLLWDTMIALRCGFQLVLNLFR